LALVRADDCYAERRREALSVRLWPVGDGRR
jgi:hypothetical protein